MAVRKIVWVGRFYLGRKRDSPKQICVKASHNQHWTFKSVIVAILLTSNIHADRTMPDFAFGKKCPGISLIQPLL